MDFLAQGTGQDTQQKANGHIGGKRGSTNHTQNSTHDTSSKEEEAKIGAVASNHGDIAHLTIGMAAGLSQFLISYQTQLSTVVNAYYL